MVILSPQGFRPANNWMLPAEMVDPNHFSLISPSAQQLLEARGLTGLGSATAQYGWRRSAAGPVSSGIQVIPRGMMGLGSRLTWDRFANRVVFP